MVARRGPIPAGPKTRQLFDVFQKAGGVLINPSDDDLRSFVALRMLRDQTAENGWHDEFEFMAAQPEAAARNRFLQAGGTEPAAGDTYALAAPSAGPPKPLVRPMADKPNLPSPPVSPIAAVSTLSALPATGPQALVARSPSRPEPTRSPLSPTAPLPADTIPVGRRMTVGEEPVSLPTQAAAAPCCDHCWFGFGQDGALATDRRGSSARRHSCNRDRPEQ